MKKAVAAGLLLFAFLFSSSVLFSFLVTPSEAAEGSWTTKTPMPSDVGYVGAAVVDGKIYVIGRERNYVYDPTADSWASKRPMPTARDKFAVAACDNKIYVIGGSTEFQWTTGLTEVYDPETDTWETKASMKKSRDYLSASVVNGKIYAIGGVVYGTDYYPYTTPATEVYAPSTDSWAEAAPIADFKEFWQATFDTNFASAVLDAKIHIVVGGLLVDGSRCHRIYDPETDTWGNGSDLVWLNDGISAVATSGVLAPERTHVTVMGVHLVYDPSTDAWNEAAPMPTPRKGVGLAVVDDTLYAIGGTMKYNEQYIPTGYGTVPPAISVVSPENNKTYTANNVSLAFTVNKAAQGMSYSLDGQANVTLTGNTTLTILSSGLHNVTVYAQDTLGNIGASQTIYFSIESYPQRPEPFPTTWEVAGFIIAVAVVGAGLLVYFKKYRR